MPGLSIQPVARCLTRPLPCAGRPGGVGTRRRAVPRMRPASAAPSSPAPTTTTSSTVRLPDGGSLELVSWAPAPSAPSPPFRPPLLFIHGSAHAAWCWAEHFLPWFAGRGWASHAVSLRGRGGSGPPPPGARAGGTLASHAADVAAVIAAAGLGPPVVVGHSFGGLVAQRLAAGPPPGATALAGLVLAASVPPSGNGPMVKRIAAERGLWASAVLTADFIFKTYRKDSAAARRLFFSDALPEAEVVRLMGLLAAQDGATPVIDVRAIGAELPVARPSPALPALVLGGGADKIVDAGGLAESAAAVGAGDPVVLEGVAHDLMLDVGWEGAAAAMEGWLEREFC